MKALLLSQSLITICGAILIWLLAGPSSAVFFSIGGSIILVNLTVHVVVWPRILVKKQVAMSIGVIVIKFLILGWIIYEVATKICAADGNRFSWRLSWFGAGLATIVVSTFATAAGVLFSASRRPPSLSADEVKEEVVL